MSTFGTMVNRIADDMARSDVTAAAKAEINSAIRHYSTRRFWFLEARATVNTVDSQEFYTLPGDFMDIDSLVITVNSWTYSLIQRTYQALEDWFVQASTFTGYPTDFAIYDQQLRLYPVPNGAYQMTLSYLQRLEDLSATASTNSWMTEGEELIRARAESRLYVNRYRDFEAAQAMQMVENDALSAMIRIQNQRIMTGSTKRRRM